MNQHSTRGINQAGERQARQGMRGTAGQAQTLRETGRRKPARKYPFLSVCGIFAISQRRQEKAGSLAPSAFAGCLPMVCRWSADGLPMVCRTNGGALPCADHGGRGVCDQKRQRTKADPPPPVCIQPTPEKTTAGAWCRDIRRKAWEGGGFHLSEAYIFIY